MEAMKTRKRKRREPLGDTVRRLRESRGLTVTDAASAADYNSVLWLKIEAEAGDETPLSTLRTIAKGLGMTLRQLAAELE